MRYFTITYSLLLVLAVCIGFCGVVAGILVTGHDVVWSTDELYQSVNALVLYGETVRTIASDFLATGVLNIPSYLLNVGYGEDYFIRLSSVAGDVFNLPAIFCPPEYVEYLDVALILARLIAAAFTFSYFCFSRGAEKPAAFAGSVCYVFAGAVVFVAALTHTFFLTPVVLLPLVLAGADKIFRNESPALFIIAFALQLIQYFYFAYMIGIALFVYCLVKYFVMPRERSVGDFVSLVSRFAVYLVIAFLISAIIVLPKILVILAQGRLGLARFNAPLLDVVDYLNALPAAIGAFSNGDGLFLCPVGILLVFVFVICGRKADKRTYIAWLIALSCISLCAVLPFFRRMFNAFAYPTDRWMFIADFVLAYVICLAFPLLKGMSSKDCKKLIGATVVLAALCIGCISYLYKWDIRSMVAVSLLLASLVVIVLIRAVGNQRLVSGIVASLCIVSVSAVTFIYCIPAGGDYAKGYIEMGTAYGKFFEQSYPSALEKYDGYESLYRCSPAKLYGGVRNASQNIPVFAVDNYTSSYNQFVDSWRKELGLADDSLSLRFIGHQGRYALEALTAVKYFIAKDGEAWMVPAGFYDTGFVKKGMHVWESDECLPIAFTTDMIIARESYDRLSMVGKQEALLQGCVLALDSDVSGTIEPDIGSYEIPYSISGGKNLVIDDGEIVVLKANAEIDLVVEPQAHCETYLQILNLNYEMMSSGEIADLTGDESRVSARKDLLAVYPKSFDMTAATELGERTLQVGTNRHAQYGGKHNWAINLGYSEAGVSEITVTFSRVGRYTFDELAVACLPVEPLRDSARNMQMGSPEEIGFDGRKLKASFNIESERSYAVFTIPYSTGWSATVDGEAATIVHADTAFMAVPIEGSGEHCIELAYETPGLRMASVLSILGLAMLVALCLLRKRRASHKK